MTDPHSSFTESELIYLIKENNKSAFDYLYKNYAPGLMFSIKRVISDDHIAEDILHETFINIWTRIDSYTPGKACFYTWMHSVARNKAIDFTRCGVHKMRARTKGNEELINPENYYSEQKTDKIGLGKMVAKLPEEHKALIYMFYYKGHTLKEMAEGLNIPLGTVKTRLRYALGSLRKDFTAIAS